MADTYVTVSGDTWDKIAYEKYGDETWCDRLMAANWEALGYMIFPAGIVLKIPDKKALVTEVTSDLPDWREALGHG